MIRAMLSVGIVMGSIFAAVFFMIGVVEMAYTQPLMAAAVFFVVLFFLLVLFVRHVQDHGRLK